MRLIETDEILRVKGVGGHTYKDIVDALDKFEQSENDVAKRLGLSDRHMADTSQYRGLNQNGGSRRNIGGHNSRYVIPKKTGRAPQLHREEHRSKAFKEKLSEELSSIVEGGPSVHVSSFDSVIRKLRAKVEDGLLSPNVKANEYTVEELLSTDLHQIVGREEISVIREIMLVLRYRNLSDELKALFDNLDDRQCHILLMRIGLIKRRTLEQLADKLGVTRERVRQIEKDAKRKLQMALRGQSIVLANLQTALWLFAEKGPYVRPADLLAYRQSIQHLAASSQSRYLAAIKSFFAWALEAGIIEKSPAPHPRASLQ
jgi:RNA polymerase sigma factor (sigma-70 family)